jgi:hypothetical protein
MSKPTQHGSRTRHEKAHQAKQWRRRKAAIPRPPLQARRAVVDPQPAPLARGYFVQQIWDKLGLEAALARVGIGKGGLPLSTVFIVVLLMGVVGATSLFGAAQLLPTDAALCTLLAVSALDEKQVYRGLASISLAQYQAWMGQLLGALQADPRTASRPDGVVISDSTQVTKNSAHKIPGVHLLFLHSEKHFALGAELLTTHYADGDKDYPLFLAFYEPDAATVAARAADKARRAAEVDGRKPAAVLAYIAQQVAAGQPPTLVIVSGPRLTPTFTAKLTELPVPWLGVSDGRRTYTLTGQAASHTAKQLLATSQPQDWQEDADLGYRLADLGAASSRVGAVRLLLAEHMADGVRTLYLTPAALSAAAALARLTLVLEQDQQQRDSGILQRTLELLRLSRSAGIRAETATFDRWYFIPWFIRAVLRLGFQRVVIKAKAGCKYTYHGQDYDLDQLWPLLAPQDFAPHVRNGRTYQLAALPVQLKGVGPVKLVFVRQPTRRGDKSLEAVLLCTDPGYANPQVLRAYLLRWRIEVCYREVKQEHAFGQFHAQDMATNYGQTMLSLVAYLFVTLARLLVPALRERTLGWIKAHYFNAIVRLTVADDPNDLRPVVEFPGWLLDDYGLPPWAAFVLPPADAGAT